MALSATALLQMSTEAMTPPRTTMRWHSSTCATHQAAFLQLLCQLPLQLLGRLLRYSRLTHRVRPGRTEAPGTTAAQLPAPAERQTAQAQSPSHRQQAQVCLQSS